MITMRAEGIPASHGHFANRTVIFFARAGKGITNAAKHAFTGLDGRLVRVEMISGPSR